MLKRRMSVIGGVRMCLSLIWRLRHLLLRSSEETRQLVRLILQEMELTNAQRLPLCRTDLLFYIFNRTLPHVMFSVYIRKFLKHCSLLAIVVICINECVIASVLESDNHNHTICRYGVEAKCDECD